jgi:hypothetical protein
LELSCDLVISLLGHVSEGMKGITNHNNWLQTILHSHSNKNSMVLAQKQTWRPIK